MKNNKSQTADAEHRQSESGNVLFLILIAVALFAALSYAVTQSSRSGSGEATSEKSLISGAQITQYPAGVRTDIIRMMIDNNISVDQLEFNGPSDFGALTLNPSGRRTRSVFHPEGGGATYQLAPADVMNSSSPGTWYYNADWSVPNIGTSSVGTDSSGNEMTAFLVDIKQSVCQKIDDALGITSSPIPVLAHGATTDFEVTQGTGANTVAPPNTYELFAAAPFDANHVLDTASSGLSGQPFGCAQTTDGKYLYYHVLLER